MKNACVSTRSEQLQILHPFQVMLELLIRT